MPVRNHGERRTTAAKSVARQESHQAAPQRAHIAIPQAAQAGHSLAPSDILDIQRSIGNRATTQLVQQPGSIQLSRSGTMSQAIQRIPWTSTVNGDRIQQVIRLSPNKPVWKIEYDDGSAVIIKFEHIQGRNDPNPAVQADALKELGRMEGTREIFQVGMKKNIVGGRHCQPAEIVDALKALHRRIPSTLGSRQLLSAAAQTQEEIFVNEYVTGIEDMDHNDGDAGRTRADGTPDYRTYSAAKQTSLQNLIFTKSNLTSLGRMIYLDTLMGSQDRLGQVAMNLENITFKSDGSANGGTVTALDNFDPNATIDDLLAPGGRMQKTAKQKMLETLYTSRRHTYANAMLAQFYQVTNYAPGTNTKDAAYILSGMDEAEKALRSKLQSLINAAQKEDARTPGGYHGEKATFLTEILRRANEAKQG